MRERLGEDAIERALWSSIKRRFTELIDALPDLEFDKTFFNSVTRRTFGTIGVDAAVEFVALDLDPMGSITTHDRDHRLRQPRLARAAVRGSARRLPLPHAVPRLRPQRADHHERSACAVRRGFGRVTPAAAGGASRAGAHAVLPDDARLSRRPHLRQGLDAALRAGAEEHRERRADRRHHDGRELRQHPVQLHALVFPRRLAARRPGGRVPQDHPAAQAGERVVHGARPRQAGQDRALPRAVPAPAAEHRSVRARAGRSWAW